MATLSDRIKELRLSFNMTQEEFGKKFGIVKSTVSLYESGKSTPNDETKMQICDYFDVSLDYLFGRDRHRELDYANSQIPLDNSKIKQITTEEEKLLNGFRKLSEDDQEEFIGILDLKLQKTHKARGTGVKSSELTNTEKGSMVG